MRTGVVVGYSDDRTIPMWVSSEAERYLCAMSTAKPVILWMQVILHH